MKRALLAALLLFAPITFAQTLAATPPMGWNSWNHFAEKVNDSVVRAAADSLVSSGLRDAGYIYVNIDDTWEGQRDAQGVIHSNEKFPDMKALADYVHSKGLKLGIYSSPGPKTCAGYEASYQHEEQDARTYAQWGIDYLKYDWCSARQVYKDSDMPAVYRKMADALRQATKTTGRPIIYSLCQYGDENVWRWGAQSGGNLWRTTDDIEDKWERMANIGFVQQPGLERYAGPGHWNDPDMLEVGNGGMTDDEYRTHFSLWALLAAPLLAGNDLAKMSPETLAILANRDVIAVDQDAAGKQGRRVWQEGPLQIWVRDLADGSKAIGLFNLGHRALPMTVNWKDFGDPQPATARDLWAHKDLGKLPDPYVVTIPKHGVIMLRVK
jgi:alpha-galactosidase